MHSKWPDQLDIPAPYPLLGREYKTADYAPVNLSTTNPELTDYDVHTFAGLDRYISDCRKKTGARVLYGGYLENRALYQRSPHFAQAEKARTLHLGLDLWEDAGTPVYAPLDGWVHSFRYNDQPLDYGGTIILTHENAEGKFHTLYGHLSRASLTGLSVNAPIDRGTPFATFGTPSENGGWVPHLHFQVILDLADWSGDYPGVCAPEEQSAYRNNCPDPAVFMLI